MAPQRHQQLLGQRGRDVARVRDEFVKERVSALRPRLTGGGIPGVRAPRTRCHSFANIRWRFWRVFAPFWAADNRCCRTVSRSRST